MCDINYFFVICFDKLANNDLENFTVYVVVLFPEVSMHTSRKANNIHVLYYKRIERKLVTLQLL